MDRPPDAYAPPPPKSKATSYVTAGMTLSAQVRSARGYSLSATRRG